MRDLSLSENIKTKPQKFHFSKTYHLKSHNMYAKKSFDQGIMMESLFA